MHSWLILHIGQGIIFLLIISSLVVSLSLSLSLSLSNSSTGYRQTLPLVNKVTGAKCLYNLFCINPFEALTFYQLTFITQLIRISSGGF